MNTILLESLSRTIHRKLQVKATRNEYIKIAFVYQRFQIKTLLMTILQTLRDVLLSHVFPLLDLDSLDAVYRTDKHGASLVNEYRQWDSMYNQLPDLVRLPGCGFPRFYRRNSAHLFYWGRIQGNFDFSADMGSMDAQGFFHISTPKQKAINSVGRILNGAQYTNMDGRLIQRSSTHSPYVISNNWGYKYDAETGTVANSPTLFLPNTTVNDRNVTRGPTHLTAPEPIIQVLPLESLFLGESGTVYKYSNDEFLPLDLPPISKLVQYYFAYYIFEGTYFSAHSSTMETRERGNLLVGLGNNGSVYYYDTTADKYVQDPNFRDIVDVQGGDQFFFALDTAGTLYACGSEFIGNLGQGEHPSVQIPNAKPATIGGLPLISSSKVSFRPIQDSEKPFLVVPQKVSLPGIVVSFCIDGYAGYAIVAP